MTPVPRQKLADLAYDAIRDSITAGDFAMGERLVETRLASELGMSRAPVREALRRLLEEGLVIERAHHGMFVRSFDGAEIVDLYNARVALEAAALRLFVRRGSSTAPLREQIERRRQAVARVASPTSWPPISRCTTSSCWAPAMRCCMTSSARSPHRP